MNFSRRPGASRSQPLPASHLDALDLEIARVSAEIERRERLADVLADRDIVRKRCQSLHGFIKEAWHVLEPAQPFVDGPHLHILCAVLEAITFGKLRAAGLRNRVVVNVPPGTMKSLTISVFWQAWEWGPCGLPHMRYLSSSYADPYVKRDTRKTRDLVFSEWYQALWGEGSGWKAPVIVERSGETSFANTATGSREGMAFGSLTSGRGDRVIVDDPQSTEEAESEAERERDERIARESLPSRVNDGENSAIVVIQQRLHERDTSGVLLALNAGWVHVCLPMYFESDRRFEIKELGIRDARANDGDLLMPSRFPKATLDIEKKVLGEHGVATQWQQRPTPRGGGFFKRANFVIKRVLPAGSFMRCRAWDLASTEEHIGADPDWTVGILVAKHIETGRFYIEHVERFRRGPADVRRTVKNTADQDGPGVRQRMRQDPGQAGKDQAEAYSRLLAGHAFVIKPYQKNEGAKMLRADPAAAQVEEGNVCILAPDGVLPEWAEPFLAEAEKFPRGAHDDQIDAFADAINELTLGLGYILTDAALA